MPGAEIPRLVGGSTIGGLELVLRYIDDPMDQEVLNESGFSVRDAVARAIWAIGQHEKNVKEHGEAEFKRGYASAMGERRKSARRSVGLGQRRAAS